MPNRQSYQPEVLLTTLGVKQPKDIDVEVIAQYCGATVVYEPLTACEARVLGLGDRAIITVNINSIEERRRFSAAHQLAHWVYARRKRAAAWTPAKIRNSCSSR